MTKLLIAFVRIVVQIIKSIPSLYSNLKVKYKYVHLWSKNTGKY